MKLSEIKRRMLISLNNEVRDWGDVPSNLKYLAEQMVYAAEARSIKDWSEEDKRIAVELAEKMLELVVKQIARKDSSLSLKEVVSELL
jgi:hypothetical protein